MRRTVLLLLLLTALAALPASTVETDGSMPPGRLVAVSRALDENTEGRGDLAFTVSGYTEDRDTFPGQRFASFTLSYGGKSVQVSALGEDSKDLEKSLEAEIHNLLYYEDLLLAPSPRLDYITKNVLYSFIPDKHYRRGTRLKAVDRDGKTRALFEVSRVYDGADTLEPVYLADPYPGLALRKAGEWVAEAGFGYGFLISKHRWFVQGSVGRSDLLYPFTPFIAAAYQTDEYSEGLYGGFGIRSSLRLHKMFPNVGFTMVRNGRVSADVAVFFGQYDKEYDWTTAFSIGYEHQVLSHLSWRAGYERFSGYNYFFLGIGGTF